MILPGGADCGCTPRVKEFMLTIEDGARERVVEELEQVPASGGMLCITAM
jgi:hypothetical protein